MIWGGEMRHQNRDLHRLCTLQITLPLSNVYEEANVRNLEGTSTFEYISPTLLGELVLHT